MRIMLLVLVLSVGYPTCRDQVVFEKLQPAGIPNAQAFPATFKGIYYRVHVDSAILDSEFFVITDNALDVRNSFTVHAHKDSLKDTSEIKIVRDSAYLKMDDKWMAAPIQTRNDTLILHYSLQRNVFAISDTAVLRTSSDYCFLNYADSSGFYFTDLLCFQKNDTLLHCSIDLSMDSTAMVKTIKTSKVVNGKRLLSPTQDELFNFIKAGGFSKKEKFKRQKVK